MVVPPNRPDTNVDGPVPVDTRVSAPRETYKYRYPYVSFQTRPT